jgi:hypothetical protein
LLAQLEKRLHGGRTGVKAKRDVERVGVGKV